MTAKCRYLQCVFTLLFVVVTNSFAGGWVQVSELPTLRIAEAAAAVNDKLYLIGGFNWDENLGGSAPPIARVDVYDTQTNTWHTAADMPTPRISAQAAVSSNQIYVFGGYNRVPIRGEPWKTVVEMYDTQTDTWTLIRDMPTLRRNFGTAVVDGKIYLIGGTVLDRQFNHQIVTNLVEVYDPLTGRWEKRADMPTERGRIQPVVVGGEVYVIGGYDLFGAGGFGDVAQQFLTQIEVYNPKTDSWLKRRNMPMFKFSFSTVAVDDEIWTIGGRVLNNRHQFIDTVEVYNPTTNRWRVREPIPTARIGMSAVVDGRIYLFSSIIAGGRFSPVVEAFDTGFRAVSAKDKRSTRWGSLKKPQ
jgi:N-acetylneuraminic acid mutarotase